MVISGKNKNKVSGCTDNAILLGERKSPRGQKLKKKKKGEMMAILYVYRFYILCKIVIEEGW